MPEHIKGNILEFIFTDKEFYECMLVGGIFYTVNVLYRIWSGKLVITDILKGDIYNGRP